MIDPFDDPPFDPDHSPLEGDEMAVVCWMLDYHRRVFLRKLDGITEEQARATAAASDLTLLGLARHMAFVEQYWFAHIFLGSDEPSHFDDSVDPDIDFHPGPDDTLAAAIELLHAEIARARRVAATTSFDTVAVRPRRDRPVKLRWILVHMVEEYARHCGHTDLIRESIDGVTGD